VVLAVATAWLIGYCVPRAGAGVGQWDHLTPGVMQNAGCNRLADGLRFKRPAVAWGGGEGAAEQQFRAEGSIERADNHGYVIDRKEEVAKNPRNRIIAKPRALKANSLSYRRTSCSYASVSIRTL
jgi:hypothetical protein